MVSRPARYRSRWATHKAQSTKCSRALTLYWREVTKPAEERRSPPLGPRLGSIEARGTHGGPAEPAGRLNSLKTEVGSKVKSKGIAIGTASSLKSPEALSADDRNMVRLLMSFIVAANHAS